MRCENGILCKPTDGWLFKPYESIPKRIVVARLSRRGLMPSISRLLGVGHCKSSEVRKGYVRYTMYDMRYA